ncbi:MAG: DNA repair protein RecO [Patescibacteria group bacterium]
MLKTPALILKKQNLGETDRILTIFSPFLGKKRVIVRGVRRPLSKLAGHLDTMMLTQIMLTDEDELPKVAGALLAEPFENIRNSLTLLNRAYAITKIIERVIVEDVAERPIFQLTIDCLMRLNNNEKWAAIWLHFLSRLTGRLGLSITDFTCFNCKKEINEGASWLFDEHKFSCHSCVNEALTLELEPNSIKMLKLLGKENYSLILRVGIPDKVAQEVEEVFLRLVTEWLNKPWTTYASLQVSKNDSSFLILDSKF